MPRNILIAIFCSCNLLASAQTSSLSGDWSGKLKIQSFELKLVFHLKEENGITSCTMDSPSQNAFGIPMESEVTTSSFVFSQKAASIRFEGKRYSDSLSGLFIQNGMELPLTLYPLTIEPTQRIQAYQEEEVVFFAKDGTELHGTLTIPLHAKKHPALVLITGSGPQNRNEEIFGHEPFRAIAEYLTSKGYAILRYDDRGVGASKGDFKKATTYDLANDVQAAVSFLSKRKDISKKRIGLIGHSEGGTIAPMVAAQNKRIHGIILLAGTGLRGDSILLGQQEIMGKKTSADSSLLRKNLELNKRIYTYIVSHPEVSTVNAELRQLVLDFQSENIEFFERMQLTPDNYLEIFDGAWLWEFIRLDPAKYLSKVTCPVLAINGELDVQVEASLNLSAIERNLKLAGNTNFYCWKVPGHNHLFQHAKSGWIEEYGNLEEDFSEEVLERMVKWLDEINF